MKQLSINPLSKLYMNVVVYIFFLLSPLVFGQQTLDIDQEQNKKIEALEKKIEELEEMMVDKNLSGDIVAKSITVENDEGRVFITKGYIATYNDDGKRTTYLGTGENNIGFFQAANADGKNVAYLGSAKAGDGLLTINNKLGGQMVAIYNNVDDDDDKTATINVYHPSGELAAVLASLNEDGEEASVLFLRNNEDHGIGLFASKTGSEMVIYYKDEKVGAFGATDNGSGRLSLNNKDSESLVFIGPSKDGDGMLTLNNKNANQIVYLGPNKSSHGLIIINDRYGEYKWGESGQR